MAQLKEIAQRVMDLYYQNYAPNDRFLDFDDFKFHIAAMYTTMLDTQFQEQRKIGKSETGFSNIEIPSQWLVEEIMEIKYDAVLDNFYTETKMPVLAFRWDGSANSLVGIHSVGEPHVTYRKIMINERRFRQVIPTIGKVLFYLENAKRIVYWDAKVGHKVKGQYIPAVVGQQDDCLIADSIANEITATMELMMKAKNGVFIQKADDQNPNVIPQQQTNPALQRS